MIYNILIFAAGLAVYAGYGLPGLIYLLGATALSYGAGRLIPKYKWVLWISVGLNSLALLAVKAQPLLGWKFLAPVGISYFTLQIIAYNADIYRGKYGPETNFLRYALHITYLPHIFIGPIEPYPSMMHSLDNRKMTWEGVADGAVRAVWGLFKKYVIAARAGVVIAAISAEPGSYRGAFALAAMLLYSLQLYADFSGGMDMVLGLSRMLGLKLSENFDTPYFSESFREFWRRWHMTLGGWLREYVYIPLGGNRKGTLRKYLNTVVTFLVSGLWHGIHYLLWGLLNGIFVAFGEKLKTRWRPVNQIITFLLVTLLWSFFVWPETGTALTMLGSLFTTFNYGEFFTSVGALGLELSDWIVLAAAALLLWGFDWKGAGLKERFRGLCPALKTAVICALGLLVLVFGMYGIGFDASEFIYSRF